MNSRQINILLAALPGVYMSLVVFNNVFDYNSNYVFLSNVASMSEVFSGEANRWRSVSSPMLHHIMYIMVIIWEFLTAAILLYGTIHMWQRRSADREIFRASKKYVFLGLSMGVTLWFTAFITIAGEWFLMWQSTKWNGSHTAFFLSGIFLLLLLVQWNVDEREE
jgi:predicted small integral membrane protein